jgi:hypothetical protein
MSVRMDRDNYDFLHEFTKEEGSDLSKALRDMVRRGRILLAVERYKKGEASLGRAAALAGSSLRADDGHPYGIRRRKQARKGRLSRGTREPPEGLVMAARFPRY